MKYFDVILLLGLSALSHSVNAQSAFDKMTNEKMSKILLREAEEVEGDLGRWQFKFNNLQLYILTDENANRMRVMTPIVEEKALEKDQYKAMLEANFDRALDAKYSIYQDVVWSVYTHPLGELTVEQFKDALNQVARLSQNFGGSYTSTDWTFQGDNEN